MNFLDKAFAKWNQFWEKAQPIFKRICVFFHKVGLALKAFFGFLYRLRKVFLAIPVGYGAIRLALYNLKNLPAVVGIDLQTSGDFNIRVIRELAVLGPVALTAVCLLLMFVSRRTLTPWLVSLFSLCVPILILFTNMFPA